jgi:hypothetical protein
MTGFVMLRAPSVVLVVALAPASVVAPDVRPRFIPAPDRSDLRGPFYCRIFSALRELMREVFDFLSAQAATRNVAHYLKASPEAVRIEGNPIQLQ